ncbi:MAG: hypothetical protein Q8N85_00005, partial [Candidatus Omnitrophota bacterium]|nr:hypothetical protein [Candidatus Omnitrophota bacterium]
MLKETLEELGNQEMSVEAEIYGTIVEIVKIDRPTLGSPAAGDAVHNMAGGAERISDNHISRYARVSSESSDSYITRISNNYGVQVVIVATKAELDDLAKGFGIQEDVGEGFGRSDNKTDKAYAYVLKGHETDPKVMAHEITEALGRTIKGTVSAGGRMGGVSSSSAVQKVTNNPVQQTDLEDLYWGIIQRHIQPLLDVAKEGRVPESRHLIDAVNGVTEDLMQVYSDPAEQERLRTTLGNIIKEIKSGPDMKAKFAVIVAAFIGEQAIHNGHGDYINFYFPRDMAFCFPANLTIDSLNETQGQKPAGLFYISRDSFGQNNYSWVSGKIDALKHFSDTQQDLVRELAKAIIGRANSDPAFKAAVLGLGEQLKSINSTGLGSKKIRFIDTGHKTFPLLLEALFLVLPEMDQESYAGFQGFETDGLVMSSGVAVLPQLNRAAWRTQLKKFLSEHPEYAAFAVPSWGILEDAGPGQTLEHPIVYNLNGQQLEPTLEQSQLLSLWHQIIFVMGAIQYDLLIKGLVKDIEDAADKSGKEVLAADVAHEAVQNASGMISVDSPTGTTTYIVTPAEAEQEEGAQEARVAQAGEQALEERPIPVTSAPGISASDIERAVAEATDMPDFKVSEKTKEGIETLLDAKKDFDKAEVDSYNKAEKEKSEKKDKDDKPTPPKGKGPGWRIWLVRALPFLTLLIPRPSVIAGNFHYWAQDGVRWAFDTVGGQGHAGASYWFDQAHNVWHQGSPWAQELAHNVGTSYIHTDFSNVASILIAAAIVAVGVISVYLLSRRIADKSRQQQAMLKGSLTLGALSPLIFSAINIGLRLYSGLHYTWGMISGNFYHWAQFGHQWAFDSVAGQGQVGSSYVFGSDNLWHFVVNRPQLEAHNIGINYIKLAHDSTAHFNPVDLLQNPYLIAGVVILGAVILGYTIYRAVSRPKVSPAPGITPVVLPTAISPGKGLTPSRPELTAKEGEAVRGGEIEKGFSAEEKAEVLKHAIEVVGAEKIKVKVMAEIANKLASNRGERKDIQALAAAGGMEGLVSLLKKLIDSNSKIKPEDKSILKAAIDFLAKAKLKKFTPDQAIVSINKYFIGEGKSGEDAGAPGIIALIDELFNSFSTIFKSPDLLAEALLHEALEAVTEEGNHQTLYEGVQRDIFGKNKLGDAIKAYVLYRVLYGSDSGITFTKSADIKTIDISKVLGNKPDYMFIPKKFIEGAKAIYTALANAVFKPQKEMNQWLNSAYSISSELRQRIQDAGDDKEAIVAIVEEYFADLIKAAEESGRITSMQIIGMQDARDRLIRSIRAPPSRQRKELKARLRLLAFWVGSVKKAYSHHHRIYLARDAGIYHLMDKALGELEGNGEGDLGSSVYHLSRARMSGERGWTVYNMMHGFIVSAANSTDNYAEFIKEMRRQFRAAYESNEDFRRIVDAIRAELIELGYDKFERLCI